MVLVIRCQTLLEDLWTILSCCLYVFYEYYYHNIFYHCIYGFILVYNVIYVFYCYEYVFSLYVYVRLH